MLLVNRSETAFFAGVQPTSYGVLAELGVFLANAPCEFDLYVVPVKPDSKPIGTFMYPKREKGWQQTVVDIPLNIVQRDDKEQTEIEQEVSSNG